jgi:hypothetical protein
MQKVDFAACRDTLQVIQNRLGAGEGTIISMGWDGKALRITLARPALGVLPFTMTLDGTEDYSVDPETLCAEFIEKAKQHFTPGGLMTYRPN